MEWKKEGCSGKIFRSGQQVSKSIDICFDIECKIDGSIKLTIGELYYRKDMAWIIEVFHKRSSDLARFILKGQTAEGHNISSHNVYLTKASPQLRQGGKTTIFVIELECTELLVSVSDFERGLNKGKSGCMRYDLPGFRCFQTVSTIAEVGEIRAAGSTTIENYDNITGAISIVIERPGRVKDWMKRAEEQMELILDIFSLAGGRYLEWGRRSLYLGDNWIETVFRSPSHRGKPNHPIFHFLNMQPILELAVKRYNNNIKQTTGFGIALEQFLIPSLYLESQFTTSFMALEHLVNTFANNRQRNTILSEEDFSNFVKPAVMKGLKQAKDSMKATRLTTAADTGSIKKPFKAIEGKIAELNRYPFIQNMWKFLDEIAVPLDGLSRVEIDKVVQMRHTIIHSGAVMSNNTRGKQQGLSLLRELLTRIFLTLLKFEGEYASYLTGQQYVHFPPVLK
jgi:hypothetical protein